MKRKDALWVMQMCRDRDARSEAEREAFDTAIEALQADTVEVVRCKECIHHDDFFMGAEGSLLCWKGGTDKVVSAMGYCECGERSEE